MQHIVAQDAVRARFRADMAKTDWGDWLYNSDCNLFGVSDMGYFAGYEMASGFYERAHDRRAAIRAMIHRAMATRRPCGTISRGRVTWRTVTSRRRDDAEESLEFRRGIAVMTQRTLVGALLLFGMAAAVPATARTDPTLDAVLARFDADEHPDLRGVVVMRDGRIIAERYYNGEKPDSLHDIRSAGKSITSLLVGIAIDQGKIRRIDDPVAQYWIEAKGSAIGDVPLRDALTMRSGLAAFDEDPASPGNEDRMDEAADPLAFLLSVPRAD